MGNAFVPILLGIVGLAVVAVLVSKNAQTGSVLSAGSTGFAQILGAATSPVTGQGISAGSTGITSLGGF